MVLAFIFRYQGADNIHEFSERMLLVAASLIEQMIQDIHEFVVFRLIVRDE